MLSQHSDQSVAAVGLANQWIVVATLVYGFINIGTTIQLTQLSSLGEKDRSTKVILHALLLNILLTMILMTVLLGFHQLLLNMIHTPASLVKEAATYLRIIAYGLAFHALIGLLGSILRSYALVRFAMMVSILINIINIILNYLVLMTPVTWFGEGVHGVAVATNISRIIGAVILIIYFISYRHAFLSGFTKLKLDFKALKKILVLGVPSAGEHVSYNVSQVLITGFIATLGAATITAKIYAQTTTSVVFAISMAISQAGQIIIGKLIGNHQKNDAYHFSVKLLMKSVLVMTLLTALIACGSLYFVSWITSNEDIIRLTLPLVFLSILLEPARTVNVFLVSALNVAGDVKYPVMVSMIVMWGFVIPASYIVGVWLGYGLIGIWLVFIMDEWIRASLLFFRWKKGNWRALNILVD